MLYECPECGQPATKAMYAGIPMKLCGDVECGSCFGTLSFVMQYLPFNGWMIRYENYWSCLWELITGKIQEEAERL